MNKYRIYVDSVQIKGSSKGNLAALSSENVISEYCECDHSACKEYEADTLEMYAPEGKKALWKENKYELTDITAAMDFEPNEEQEAVLIHETKDSDHSGDYILIGHCADFYLYDKEYTDEEFEDLIKNSTVCTDYSFDEEREVYICR